MIPAWRRYAVTRLCLAQKKHLIGELAARGITARVVVVANDENLDIATEYGYDTVSQKNVLGLKLNDGIEYACRRDADWVSFVGSDDWLHEDAVRPIIAESEQSRPSLVAGHVVTIVDLERGRLRRLGVRGPEGVSPYIIPRWMLEPSGFRPVDDKLDRGMEGSLRCGLPVSIHRVFHDPHPLCRVDFKTAANMTPYDRVSKLLGYGPEERPWPVLEQQYPSDLVRLARRVHEQVRPGGLNA